MEIYIIRNGSWMSRHIPYDIMIDSKKHGAFIKGESYSIKLPVQRCVLKIRETGTQNDKVRNQDDVDASFALLGN
ncbi:MAG: hypothetical protein NC115_10615 [Bacteroidales bacterium]|nr:hypothetical protein [Clostridium sp.]MCM1503099.1 hypothetical protein [Bacteroidales bacterium]